MTINIEKHDGIFAGSGGATGGASKDLFVLSNATTNGQEVLFKYANGYYIAVTRYNYTQQFGVYNAQGILLRTVNTNDPNMYLKGFDPTGTEFYWIANNDDWNVKLTSNTSGTQTGTFALNTAQGQLSMSDFPTMTSNNQRIFRRNSNNNVELYDKTTKTHVATGGALSGSDFFAIEKGLVVTGKDIIFIENDGKSNWDNNSLYANHKCTILFGIGMG